MYFRPSVSWSKVGIGIPAFRFFPKGFLFDVAGTSIFADGDRLLHLAAICNSNVVQAILAATSPTLNVEAGTSAQLTVRYASPTATDPVRETFQAHRADCNLPTPSLDLGSLPPVISG